MVMLAVKGTRIKEENIIVEKPIVKWREGWDIECKMKLTGHFEQ